MLPDFRAHTHVEWTETGPLLTVLDDNTYKCLGYAESTQN
jgi:hypothetical protein